MKGESRKLLLQYAAQLGIRSQADLARALGVTPQSVSLLVQGKRTMSAETALVICNELNADVAETLRRLALEREQRSQKGFARGAGVPRKGESNITRPRRTVQQRLL